jgi:hypothetical protein
MASLRYGDESLEISLKESLGMQKITVSAEDMSDKKFVATTFLLRT